MHVTYRKPLQPALLAFARLLIPNLLLGQQDRRSFVRIEAGRAEIHDPSSSGAAVALHLGRKADREGVVRWDLGASYSAADEGYFTLEFGAEVRPFAHAFITPVVGVGAGLLTEPEFTGQIIRATLALEAELSEVLALRLGGQIGGHGGERGPHLVFGGLEFRGRGS